MIWKPYPENKPTPCDHLVTVNGTVTIAPYNPRAKTYDQSGIKCYVPAWEDVSLGGFLDNVTAFMPLPEPYQGEE